MLLVSPNGSSVRHDVVHNSSPDQQPQINEAANIVPHIQNVQKYIKRTVFFTLMRRAENNKFLFDIKVCKVRSIK